MELKDILKLYRRHPQVEKLRKMLDGKGKTTPAAVSAAGLQGSAAAVVAASLYEASPKEPWLVVMSDEEEAGYFYHDLSTLLPGRPVLFFPSSYRRAAKYGQRDAASEVLRTEVTTMLAAATQVPMVVTHPAALAERVAKPETVAEHTVSLRVGGTYDLPSLEHRLLAFAAPTTSTNQASLPYVAAYSTSTHMQPTNPCALTSSATRWRASAPLT